LAISVPQLLLWAGLRAEPVAWIIASTAIQQTSRNPMIAELAALIMNRRPARKIA